MVAAIQMKKKARKLAAVKYPGEWRKMYLIRQERGHEENLEKVGKADLRQPHPVFLLATQLVHDSLLNLLLTSLVNVTATGRSTPERPVVRNAFRRSNLEFPPLKFPGSAGLLVSGSILGKLFFDTKKD